MEPAPPQKKRDVTARAAALLAGAAVLGLGIVLAVLLSPATRKADEAVDKLLDPAPRPRGVGEAEIVLGMTGPFTGANRELGRAMRAGLGAALGEVDAAGGIHGRRLRLVAVDDGYEPARTQGAVKQLVEQDRVLALLGSVGTPTAAVTAPYARAQRVVLLGALSGGDVLRPTPPERYVFNFRPSYAEETAAAVRWLVGVRKIPPGRVAVFAQEDAFGESGWRGVADELGQRGVAADRIFRTGYRRNGDDVGPAVAALQRRGREVEAVVTVATYRAAAAFVKRLRAVGVKVLVTCVSAVDANALSEELGADRGAAPVLVTQVVPPPTARLPGVERFRAAMARHGGGERPGFVALEGWAVGEILVEALRRAGRELDGEKLVDALEGLKDLDLGLGAPVTFGPERHQGSRRVFGVLLQPDGTFRPVDVD